MDFSLLVLRFFFMLAISLLAQLNSSMTTTQQRISFLCNFLLDNDFFSAPLFHTIILPCSFLFFFIIVSNSKHQQQPSRVVLLNFSLFLSFFALLSRTSLIVQNDICLRHISQHIICQPTAKTSARFIFNTFKWQPRQSTIFRIFSSTSENFGLLRNLITLKCSG